MELLCRGTLDDRAEIIDFGNYVFSYSHEPHDFVTLVPRLYGKGQHSEPYHYLMKEDGRIKAMVCAYPMRWMVGDTELKMSFIGTVSVHPYARSRGYMKRLMAAALEDMRREGYHLTSLGGQRQRYRYYGYELSGVEYRFTVNQSNLRHSFQKVEPLTVLPLEEKDAGKAAALYQERRVRGVRSPEEFYLMLHNWASVPYGLYHNSTFVGYGVVGGQTIYELVLCGEEYLLPAVKGLMTALDRRNVRISVPEYFQERIALLSDVCEEYAVEPNHNFQIFDYPAVIRAYLALKGQYRTLADGDCCLEMEGKSIEVSVKNGAVTVTECAGKTPDVSLTGPEAVAFLSAPISAKRMALQKRMPFLDSWFPLPVYVDSVDAC